MGDEGALELDHKDVGCGPLTILPERKRYHGSPGLGTGMAGLGLSLN